MIANNEYSALTLAHPLMIAVTALVSVIKMCGDVEGKDLFDAIEMRSLAVGVPINSACFDEACEKVDFYYCRELDIYCSRELRDEVRNRTFMHVSR